MKNRISNSIEFDSIWDQAFDLAKAILDKLMGRLEIVKITKDDKGNIEVKREGITTQVSSCGMYTEEVYEIRAAGYPALEWDDPCIIIDGRFSVFYAKDGEILIKLFVVEIDKLQGKVDINPVFLRTFIILYNIGKIFSYNYLGNKGDKNRFNSLEENLKNSIALIFLNKAIYNITKGEEIIAEFEKFVNMLCSDEYLLKEVYSIMKNKDINHCLSLLDTIANDSKLNSYVDIEPLLGANEFNLL